MSEQEWPRQYGPCIVCGATNYGMSMGGPTICPSCDCGPPKPRDVRLVREAYEATCSELARERAAHEETRREQDAIMDDYQDLGRVWMEESEKLESALEQARRELADRRWFCPMCQRQVEPFHESDGGPDEGD